MNVVVTTQTTPAPDYVTVSHVLPDTLCSHREIASAIKPDVVREPQRIVVEVSGRQYTYSCDCPVQIGDVAVCPSSRHPDLEFNGKVVGIGSSYVGRVKPVKRITQWGFLQSKVHNDINRVYEDVIDDKLTVRNACQAYKKRVLGWTGMSLHEKRYALQQLLDLMRTRKPEDDFITALEKTKPA